jgi:ABC-type uncharacterized transport system permease subunit
MILSVGSDAASAAGTAVALGLSSAIALLGYALSGLLGATRAPGLQRTALLVGWLAHGVAILVDAGGVGSPATSARFGFAPALSATAWLVVAVYGVESRFLPMPTMHRPLALACMIAVILAWVFPAEIRAPSVSPWAPLHWVLGIASYGLFGAAVLHAALLNRAERQLRAKRNAPEGGVGIPLLRLESLTFRFVVAGFGVLSAALLLGAWFANPWRWDHKTVFSVLAWVVFAALLAGRRVFGWRGLHATRWLYAGAVLLLLAYVGSRFVLEVLLHRTPSA